MIFQNSIKYIIPFLLNCILLQSILSKSSPNNTTTNSNSSILYTEKINSNTSATISNHSSSIIPFVEKDNNSSVTPISTDHNETSVQLENQELSPGPLTLSELEDETATIAYKFRGPNPLILKKEQDETIPLSEEDQKIRDAWGGTCTNDHWQKCNRLKIWGEPGGDYEKDPNANGKLVWRWKGIHCDLPEEQFYCLFNGWTTRRCHILCMAQCNKDYIFKYDSVVKHEGQCKSPVIG